VSLKDLPAIFNKGHFDLIILAGVIYHIFSPLEAIAICRNLLKENGLMLVETAMARGKEPKLMLNTEMEDPIAQEKGTSDHVVSQGYDEVLRDGRARFSEDRRGRAPYHVSRSGLQAI
ncbi:MAG: class I SAM-dependent methyltransferase, partial [Pseudomonadota bacterium]|nr:class I SAM-dependent methyltransferase [Pseudomonadota bacterium]